MYSSIPVLLFFAACAAFSGYHIAHEDYYLAAFPLLLFPLGYIHGNLLNYEIYDFKWWLAGKLSNRSADPVVEKRLRTLDYVLIIVFGSLGVAAALHFSAAG